MYQLCGCIHHPADNTLCKIGHPGLVLMRQVGGHRLDARRRQRCRNALVLKSIEFPIACCCCVTVGVGYGDGAVDVGIDISFCILQFIGNGVISVGVQCDGYIAAGYVDGVCTAVAVRYIGIGDAAGMVGPVHNPCAYDGCHGLGKRLEIQLCSIDSIAHGAIPVGLKGYKEHLVCISCRIAVIYLHLREVERRSYYLRLSRFTINGGEGRIRLPCAYLQADVGSDACVVGCLYGAGPVAARYVLVHHKATNRSGCSRDGCGVPAVGIRGRRTGGSCAVPPPNPQTVSRVHGAVRRFAYADGDVGGLGSGVVTNGAVGDAEGEALLACARYEERRIGLVLGDADG